MKQYLFSLLILTSVLLMTVPVHAQDYGLNATADAADLDQYGTSVPALVGKVIGAGLSLVSVVFFMLMIYGGIRWMISRGNEDQAKKALDTIVAAIIGLIIVMASYAITNFVFNSVKVDAGGGSATPTVTQSTQEYVCVTKPSFCSALTTDCETGINGVYCISFEGECRPQQTLSPCYSICTGANGRCTDTQKITCDQEVRCVSEAV